MSTREFTFPVVSNAFDWETPGIGAVSNITPASGAGSTINSVATTFTGIAGTTRGLYRDSGITYSPDVGLAGTVLVNSGGHNDHNSNAVHKFDCKTAIWSQWKAAANVYRTATMNFESESTRGFFLSATGAAANPVVDNNVRDPNGEYSQQDVDGVRTGQPGSTHSYSHLLVLPPGTVSSGYALWRYSAALGWSNSRAAAYPGHWTDLTSGATPQTNPWTHYGGGTNFDYSNGSAYYNGKVYSFEGSTSNTAYAFDLANPAASATWQYGTAFQNGSGFVTQITDGGVAYFLMVSGSASDDRAANGGNGRPRVRLIRIADRVVFVPTMNNHTTLPVEPIINSSGGTVAQVDDFYYSACWSEEKRAIYLTRWKSSHTAAGASAPYFIGTSQGVTAQSHTTTKVYKLAAGASLTDPWTVSEQTVAPYYTPDTGSQMRPRSFYINGCVLNFASTGAPVQAIGVS
jgi:hypothetical protein